MILRPRATFHHARGVVAMPAIVRRESIMAVKTLPAGVALDAAGNEHQAFTTTEYDAGIIRLPFFFKRRLGWEYQAY